MPLHSYLADVSLHVTYSCPLVAPFAPPTELVFGAAGRAGLKIIDAACSALIQSEVYRVPFTSLANFREAIFAVNAHLVHGDGATLHNLGDSMSQLILDSFALLLSYWVFMKILYLLFSLSMLMLWPVVYYLHRRDVKKFKQSSSRTWAGMENDAYAAYEQRRLNRFLFRYLLHKTHHADLQSTPLYSLLHPVNQTMPTLQAVTASSGVQTRAQKRKKEEDETWVSRIQRLENLVDDDILSSEDQYRMRDHEERNAFLRSIKERRMNFFALARHIQHDYSFKKRVRKVWRKVAGVPFMLLAVCLIPGVLIRLIGLQSVALPRTR
jgi:hypothetical protein